MAKLSELVPGAKVTPSGAVVSKGANTVTASGTAAPDASFTDTEAMPSDTAATLKLLPFRTTVATPGLEVVAV